MAEPVHLKSPMVFNARGVAATLVQGSEAEIANCVLNICECIIGTREDSPEFGIPDQLFTTVPLDLESLQAAIARWEPRAELTLTEAEELAPAFRRVGIEV